ncbi:leucine-rich repeat-containing protein 56 isoform X1 [Alosa sapidissima]|uniref:leucine-rich repeat-containing protein 56 isoform X1 n=2 Tax=Alosa sapidissima TaxID=34773 RepID=UPI001C0A4341|nr:leucine-rich repeat-containing protein 56 isoform X1 [Alosa sapidissima]XP_041965285.1 leucine-rich repeat-containing protein 56 isoform X1 [Alosa sapidissima]
MSMMDSFEKSRCASRPGTACMLITEFGGASQMNPTPTNYEDAEVLTELNLSSEKLKALTNTEDLGKVTMLELCVDTQHNTLGNFGTYLPNLTQLRMSNSLIFSVRDLGTTLSHLKVLWLVRCCLTDLDGIAALSSLKELYVAYNNISDLSQVSMLECLEVLDLEGNDVDDLVQVQYLGLCSQLRTLTLEGNPVCSCPRPEATETEEYSYWSAVRELVPQLRYLDDVPVEEAVAGSRAAVDEDLALLKESIKENASSSNMQYLVGLPFCVTSIEDRAASACSLSRPGSAQRPGSSRCPSSRPGSSRTLSSPGYSSRPGSGESDPDNSEPDASELTHGAGRVLLCGNPVQALRALRQKGKPQAPAFPPNSYRLPSHVPEHTYDTYEESEEWNRSDVFAELLAWRDEHNKRLLAIEKDRQPQVMAILHGEEDDEDSTDEDEEVTGHSLASDHEEEKETKTKESGEKRSSKCWSRIDSPDSSFLSLSSDLSEQEAMSPDDDSRPSLPSELTLTPSPPQPPVLPSTGRKLPEARARRLKSIQHQPPPGTRPSPLGAESGPEAGPEPGDEEVEVEVVRRHSLTDWSTSGACRPASSPVVPGHREPYVEAAGGYALSNNSKHHQPVISSKLTDRAALARPRTARAALQRLSNHYPLLPRRASTQPK